MIDWEKVNALIAAENKRQMERRDAILKPLFYERWYHGQYEFIDHTDPRAVGGVDTIARGITIDEKIVRYPRDKVTKEPRAEPYTAFFIETMSCTVPGDEYLGWFVTNTTDLILYCSPTTPEETTLDCHILPLIPLRAWFFSLDFKRRYRRHIVEEVEFKTEGYIVPIEDVRAAIGHRTKTLTQPPSHAVIHYCNVCGKEGPFGFEVSIRNGREGQWFCRDHQPKP